MVAKVCVAVLISVAISANDTNSTLVAKNQSSKKIYEENCMVCHRQLSFDLKRIYFDYLLKYSSKKVVKLALIDYLKNPNSDTSVMPKDYIRRFGVKKPTLLNDIELKKAVDYYWEKYKISGKLK